MMKPRQISFCSCGMLGSSEITSCMVMGGHLSRVPQEVRYFALYCKAGFERMGGGMLLHEGAMTRELKAGSRVVRIVQKWQALPEGWVKLNSDAGYRLDTGRASTGVMVSDSQGMVLLSAWQSLENFASVDEAEACLQGIRLARVWIDQPMIVEADCVGLIKALMMGVQSRAPWAGVISEIRVVGQLPPECRFSHIRREANRVAHELAQ
jgi:hypothetical protein